MGILEIKKLDIEERMLLIEQIWDSIYDENKQIDSPSWHKKIINHRLELIKSGKMKFFSIAEVKREVYANR